MKSIDHQEIDKLFTPLPIRIEIRLFRWNVLADWCQRGVRVIAITEEIDLSGPACHLIASLLFGIAEIELQHVKERQPIGIALATSDIRL